MNLLLDALWHKRITHYLRELSIPLFILQRLQIQVVLVHQLLLDKNPLVSSVLISIEAEPSKQRFFVVGVWNRLIQEWIIDLICEVGCSINQFLLKNCLWFQWKKNTNYSNYISFVIMKMNYVNPFSFIDSDNLEHHRLMSFYLQINRLFSQVPTIWISLLLLSTIVN